MLSLKRFPSPCAVSLLILIKNSDDNILNFTFLKISDGETV